MNNLRNFLVLVVFSLLSAQAARADDMSDARMTATTILAAIEQRNNSAVWDQHVSGWFKEKMTKDAFLANLAMMSGQLGGAGSGRKLVQQHHSDGDPRVGYKGDIFSFTFATAFPSGKIYENITLIRDGGTYKLSGIYFVPNPN